MRARGFRQTEDARGCAIAWRLASATSNRANTVDSTASLRSRGSFGWLERRSARDDLAHPDVHVHQGRERSGGEVPARCSGTCSTSRRFRSGCNSYLGHHFVCGNRHALNVGHALHFLFACALDPASTWVFEPPLARYSGCCCAQSERPGASRTAKKRTDELQPDALHVVCQFGRWPRLGPGWSAAGEWICHGKSQINPSDGRCCAPPRKCVRHDGLVADCL